MWDEGSSAFRIFRLDVGTQRWVGTGVMLDTRAKSRADVLWDVASGKLYVASHVFRKNTGPSSTRNGRLWRFSYDTLMDTYSLESGFPVDINQSDSETLVIEKDSTGRLWATWVEESPDGSGTYRVFVSHTLGSDAVWEAPFVLPVAGTSVGADDISSVVAFGGRVGVLWSNQDDSAMYWAEHVDTEPLTDWGTGRTAVQGPKEADDHINLKSLVTDGGGRVFAAVKTSHNTSAAPSIVLLVRDPATGDWSSHRVWRVSEKPTRPIVLLEEDAGVIHVFASDEGGGSVWEKTSPIDAISFPDGEGTVVIRDADKLQMNNATSTKQNVNATTGLVVLASNPWSSTDRHYWHHYDPLQPIAPTADFAADPVSGPAPLAVQFTDTSVGSPTSWEWDFRDDGVVDSTEQSPEFTYSDPGTYTVTLTVANALGGDSETKTNLVTVGETSAEVSFLPTDDAYVRSSSSSENNGSKSILRVRQSSADVDSYLLFDVSGLSGAVVEARLRLFANDGSSDGGTAFPVAETSWDETTITWSSAPGFDGGSPLGSFGGVAAGAWVEVDVTSAVAGNGLVSFAVSNGVSDLVDYSSKEGSNPPELVVVQETGPPPAPEAPQNTSPPTISGDAVEGATLTADPGEWSGSPAPSFSYQWLECDESGAPCVAIAGAIGQEYVLSAGEVGSTIRVAVTGTNSEGQETATSDPTDVVVAAPAVSEFVSAAVADAWVRSSSPDSNYGSTPYLRVRQSSVDIDAYLRFEVSGLSGPVVGAVLRLFVEDGGSDGGTVFAAAGPWEESTITWSNAPGFDGGSPLGGPVAAVAGTWVEIDVTGSVTGNDSYSFVLSSGSSDLVEYTSREGANPPQLVITVES